MSVEGPANSVEAAELPAGEAYQMAATVVAEAANGCSTKHTKVTPTSAVFALDPFVALPGERRMTQNQDYLNLAGVANYSTR